MIENVLQLVNFSCSKKKITLGFLITSCFHTYQSQRFQIISNVGSTNWMHSTGGSISVVVRKKNRRWLFWPHHVHTCQSQYFQAMHCIKMLELPTGCRASKWSQGLVSLLCFLVNKQNKTAISCSWPKAFDQGSVKVDGKHAILHWVLGIES